MARSAAARRRARLLVRVAAGVSTSLAAGTAWAQPGLETEDPRGFRLDWVRTGTAAAACPRGGEIEREVRRRLTAPEDADPVEAVVASDPPGFMVRAVATDAAGRARVRELRSDAEDCDEVARASVIAIALLLDPWANVAPVVEPPPSESVPAEAVVASEPATPPAPAGPSGGLDLLAGGLAQAGTLPEVSAGLRLEGRWRFRPPFGVSLGLEALPEVRTDAFGFSLVAASVGVAVQTRLGRWSVGGGVDVHGGLMSAVVYPSDEVVPTGPGSYGWAAVSADGRVGVQVIDRLGLEARVGPLVSLTRQPFEVAGASDPAFREEIVAFRGLLAVVVRFDE